MSNCVVNNGKEISGIGLKKTKSGNCLRLAVLIPLLRYNSCISRKKAAIRVYEKLEITKVAQKDISNIKMISYF